MTSSPRSATSCCPTPTSGQVEGGPMTDRGMFSLDGRVAMVTGGGGGLGSALAEAFAGAGARVAVVGRTESTLETVVERVAAAGSEGLAVVADATDEDAAEAAVRTTLERFGRVDILVDAVGGRGSQGPPPARGQPPGCSGLGLEAHP